MEIDNAIFRVMERCGKEMFFIMAIKKFWVFVWKNFKVS